MDGETTWMNSTEHIFLEICFKNLINFDLENIFERVTQCDTLWRTETTCFWFSEEENYNSNV
jgi:hypothetical protein